jgi:hypothetical protein
MNCELRTVFLLRLFVRLMLAAAVTELLELKPTRSRLLVLRRRVIPLLALGALQRNNLAHFSILSEVVHSLLPHLALRPKGGPPDAASVTS